MRSFAVWYCKNSDNLEDKELTVHVNLWDKKEANKKNYCFDFGFLIEDIKDIKSIYLYVPFRADKSQIKDLGSIISNNQLVNAIFNENFITTNGKHPKRFLVNGNSDKSSFVIYSLNVEDETSITKCKQGSIIEINVNNILENIPPSDIDTYRYYFRVRIQIDSNEINLINDEVKGVSIFSDQFTNTEIIDFRLNDLRSCSEELREQFRRGQHFKILAVHYLILRNSNDLIIHHGKSVNSRILEHDLWKDYIDGTDDNIIAYHIKSKAEKEIGKYIEDFSDLARFQYQKGTKMVIATYVGVILFLGAVGGVIGNLVSKYILKI